MTLKDLLKESYHDGMTTEEIAAALSEIDFPTDHSGELDNLRKALAKSNSEAASYKKQLREKMSAEEIREKEDAEKRDKLQSDYDALLKRVRVSENKARFLSLGYDEETASKVAQALVDGDFDSLFENQKKHMDAVEKRVRAEVLQGTPRPEGGSGRGMSADDILNIKDSAERQAAIAQNIDLFGEE